MSHKGSTFLDEERGFRYASQRAARPQAQFQTLRNRVHWLLLANGCPEGRFQERERLAYRDFRSQDRAVFAGIEPPHTDLIIFEREF
jgi:hypothetical protein